MKSRTGPTNVEIHNGSNPHVNQGIDPLDHKHDKKGPNNPQQRDPGVAYAGVERSWSSLDILFLEPGL